MDEKILIKSEQDRKVARILLIWAGAFFLISIILMSSLLVETEETNSFYMYGVKLENTEMVNGFERAFDDAYVDDGSALASVVIFFLCLVLGCIFLIVFFTLYKCEISVTDKNVRGKTFFGKEVVLPINMISAYSTGSFMSTIAVATSSGLTKFALIGNYEEIGNVLSRMINERQDNTAKIESDSQTTNHGMDDLVKLKNLLDQGIITQEEFDAKKKQLLGL